jgi:hypothetical protein
VDVTPRTVSFGNVEFRENFPYTNVWTWPDGTNDSFSSDPKAWNVGCDNNTEDNIQDRLEPITRLYDGTAYVDFSYTVTWQEQYKNEAGEWVTFVDGESTVTQFRGTGEAKVTNRGVSGIWQGPWQ